MTSSLVTTALLVAAEEGHRTKELPMPAWAFGLVTFAILMGLLAFLWSFRHAGLKHDKTVQGKKH